MSDDIKRDLQAWLATRPEVIQELGNRLPPWNRYRLTTTGQHCSVYSYSENGTVTITVDGHDSEFLNAVNQVCPVNVFGIIPDDLEVLT